MTSLSFTKSNKDAKPIAVVSSTNKSLDGQHVYIKDDIDNLGSADDLIEEINLKEGKFIPLPVVKPNQRNAIFISGPSGSGKSYWTRDHINALRKAGPKKPVYLFTQSVDPDPAFANLKDFHKVNIHSEKLFELKVAGLKNSIIIMDDWDQGFNVPVIKFLFQLVRIALERGRKLQIDVILVMHDTLQAHKTKNIIFESNAYVLFPMASKSSTLKFLRAYMGFDKKQLDMVSKMRSRSIYISKQAPQFLISDKKILLL